MTGLTPMPLPFSLKVIYQAGLYSLKLDDL